MNNKFFVVKLINWNPENKLESIVVVPSVWVHDSQVPPVVSYEFSDNAEDVELINSLRANSVRPPESWPKFLFQKIAEYSKWSVFRGKNLYIHVTYFL